MRYPKNITCDQQADLERDVSNEEIKRAVWDCGTNKSPGPDGFSFGFYRRFWYLIENDVYDVVNPGANTVKDFRPISLIGSVYKIIAKILANRLVGVLGDIVNEVQSAFIADRQILDGPFILNEVLQCGVSGFKVAFVLREVVDAGNVCCGIKLKLSEIFLNMFYADDVVFYETLVIGGEKLDFLNEDEAAISIIGGRFNVALVGFWIDAKFSHMSILESLKRTVSLESTRTIFKGKDLNSKNASWVCNDILAQPGLGDSFRRTSRGGVEQAQFDELSALLQNVTVSTISDRWNWALESSGDFSVASVRKAIDDKLLPEVDSKTRWIKYVPIKVNVHAWKVKTDSLANEV
ncbi:hypothetical protein Tco_0533048 [Tanacetum coccineum]